MLHDSMDSLERYLNAAYRFLSFRSRSEKEIRDFLRKKKAPDEITERVIVKLKEQKFLNDETFARMWVESRSRVKPRSQFVLKMELKQKGISEEIIEQVMHSSQTEVHSDLALAKKLVEQKMKRYKGMEKQDIYQKLGGVLARKGFTWEVSKKAIDDSLSVEYNAD